jgi:hypothetical protein
MLSVWLVLFHDGWRRLEMAKRKLEKDETDIVSLITKIYEKHSKEIRVSPAWLATEAMNFLDPERKSQVLIYRAAHLQFRQLARGMCRIKFEGEADTHDLFPELQRRYPARHKEDVEPEYVLLEHLEEEDVTYNYDRLKSEARAKMKHADALLAWWKDKAA